MGLIQVGPACGAGRVRRKSRLCERLPLLCLLVLCGLWVLFFSRSSVSSSRVTIRPSIKVCMQSRGCAC